MEEKMPESKHAQHLNRQIIVNGIIQFQYKGQTSAISKQKITTSKVKMKRCIRVQRVIYFLRPQTAFNVFTRRMAAAKRDD